MRGPLCIALRVCGQFCTALPFCGAPSSESLLIERLVLLRSASLSKEFIQDLSYMGEENAILLREAFERSLEAEADVKEDVPTRAAEHE